MKIHAGRLLLIFTLAGLPVLMPWPQTARAEAPADCQSASTTAAMRACENARYEKAEAALNQVYQALMAKLDKQGQNKLRESQRAWLKYRTANAEFQADQARDGTLAPLIRMSVLADMTEARVGEFARGGGR